MNEEAKCPNCGNKLEQFAYCGIHNKAVYRCRTCGGGREVPKLEGAEWLIDFLREVQNEFLGKSMLDGEFSNR